MSFKFNNSSGYNYMMKLEDIQPDIHVGSQDEVGSLLGNSRKNFVKKVYSLLSLQLLITVGFVALTMSIPEYANFQAQNIWLFYLALVGSIITLVPLACCSGLAKSVPTNYILLFIFTIFESYMVSLICSLYEPQSVFLAAAATCAATIGLTIYAYNTKTDFTQCMHWMIGLFWSFLLISFIVTIINIFFIKSNVLSTLVAIGFATIYSIYIVIDTQLIMGGKNAELTLDNYVLGAVILYIDIIGLFLKILQIIGKKKN